MHAVCAKYARRCGDGGCGVHGAHGDGDDTRVWGSTPTPIVRCLASMKRSRLTLDRCARCACCAARASSTCCADVCGVTPKLRIVDQLSGRPLNRCSAELRPTHMEDSVFVGPVVGEVTDSTARVLFECSVAMEIVVSLRAGPESGALS